MDSMYCAAVACATVSWFAVNLLVWCPGILQSGVLDTRYYIRQSCLVVEMSWLPALLISRIWFSRSYGCFFRFLISATSNHRYLSSMFLFCPLWYSFSKLWLLSRHMWVQKSSVLLASLTAGNTGRSDSMYSLCRMTNSFMRWYIQCCLNLVNVIAFLYLI